MLSSNTNKIFVLDTNVLLYDYRAIYSFQEHNVVIPITILEEIDRFKKGNETINLNAREFTRELDALIGNNFLSEGTALPGGGNIIVDTNTKIDASLREIFWEDKADHRILAVAYNLSKKFGKERVTLVTKDINLRMKAKSVGLQAEDYETGKIKNIDELYTGKGLIENIDPSVIDRLYQKEIIAPEELGLTEKPLPHQYFILKNHSKSVLAVYAPDKGGLRLAEKHRAFGITPRNAEQVFALDALENPAVSLVTLTGKAGTGKTLMALAAALNKHREYKQILLARPIVPLSNKDLGFLPGDVSEKIDPYMQPLYDNLGVIRHQFDDAASEQKAIAAMLESGDLQIMALAYIRGRSISKSFFIIDEAQNLTPHEIKTIITRAGEGTKIVFTGDIYQIDSPYLDSRSNGLTYLIDKMKGQEIYAHVTLEKGERSPLAEIASNIL